MNIVFHCHYGELTGYGRAARDLLQALDDTTDAEISIAPFNGKHTSPERRYENLDTLVNRPFINPVDVEVFYATPRALASARWPETAVGLPVAMTTWETSEFPTSYEYGLDRYAAVLTPSEFCTEVISHANKYTINQPLDMAHWVQKEKPREDIHNIYRFYCIGAWNERKNMEGLLKAYLAEFSISDPVELTIISHDAHEKQIMNLIIRSGVEKKFLPRLKIPGGHLTEDALLALHHNSDCFVSATRCEGWGLGAMEAAAVGNPVILPSYGGQTDWLRYVHTQNRYDVRWEYTPAFIGPLGRGVPGQNCKQRWAEPSLVDLGRMMREAMSNKANPLVYNKQLRDSLDHTVVGPKLFETLAAIIGKE